MSTRKPIVETLSEHKTAIILAVVIIAGSSIGIYFVIDSLNAQNPERIVLATTTSTYDSGLLDYILPKFTAATGIQVTVVSVGTGTAIQYGKDGNADVILVHARSREDDFVNASVGVNNISYGVHRTCVMYNDFIIVGHSDNPAELQTDDNITSVMTKLRNGMEDGNTTFYSRGDTSGTHSKEMLLWANISWNPTSVGSVFYSEMGAGMAATLLATYEDSDDRGYTLVDKGTWLSLNDTYTTLNILAESIVGEDMLLNPYGVIAVNPMLHSHVKYISVCRFIAFLTSDYGQALINSHTRNGEVLFQPAFGKCDIIYKCPTTEEESHFWTTLQTEYADEYATLTA
jgi:tungstate transport system substrate-binding protein